MNKLAEKALVARIALTGYVTGAFDRMRSDERGQGSVEYVGIIVVVVAIVAALVAFGPTIADAIGGKLGDAVDTLNTGGE